jgi:rSAM/selenodomain-associated transferase 1
VSGTRAAVAIFAKAPEAGRAKTRLAPPLTLEEAAGVARACLEDTLRRFPPKLGAAWTLFLDGAADEALRDAAIRAGVRTAPQGEGDLGSRLALAFETLRAEGASRIVAIGADSPTLDPSRIGEALDALRRHDAVLGPAADGGYYLIGLSRDAGDLFERTPWSTRDAARVTLERAAARGFTIARLAEWYDVDDVPSLRRAARDLSETECPSLAAALRRVAAKLG